jgi:hypothetical protein
LIVYSFLFLIFLSICSSCLPCFSTMISLHSCTLLICLPSVQTPHSHLLVSLLPYSFPHPLCFFTI